MAQNLSAEQQQAVLAKIRQEVQAQALQELVQKMTEKCHAKCAGTDGDRLSSREQNCLAMCMDRYVDTMGVVNNAMVERQNSR
ncbi:unnamed protein product [Heterosigma akashiwo]|mmetsp:Transcript_5577/g.8995  ORF Transcript_5577/g.8995 Transcript_5577/m.8995 type:complete len:83 (-) Transcript_5577:270-518(-)